MNLRKRCGLASLSTIGLPICVASSLDVVGIQREGVVATIVLAVVLPIVLAVVLTVVVLTVVLTVVVLAVVLTILAVVLTILTIVLASELGLGNAGCEQQRQKGSVTHGNG